MRFRTRTLNNVQFGAYVSNNMTLPQQPAMFRTKDDAMNKATELQRYLSPLPGGTVKIDSFVVPVGIGRLNEYGRIWTISDRHGFVSNLLAFPERFAIVEAA